MCGLLIKSCVHRCQREAMSEGKEMVVMVTGGSGLVGNGIRIMVEKDQRPGEKWIFLSSKDANLMFVSVDLY